MTDGSSDRVLTRIIDWALWECGVRSELISQWADLRNLRRKPVGLVEKVAKALELYPCDLLFVNRDAEAVPRMTRVHEIRSALSGLLVPPHVSVVPVRMQESWLLCDEVAIRAAAGNPNGNMPLDMPVQAGIENLPDPKAVVFSLLKAASGRTGRKLQQFNVEFARSLICEQMSDFSILRSLESYAAFEADLKGVVSAHHLDRWP